MKTATTPEPYLNRTRRPSFSQFLDYLKGRLRLSLPPTQQPSDDELIRDFHNVIERNKLMEEKERLNASLLLFYKFF
ncbi:MAG: hypothetical protein ACXAE3_17645 [Candidatus Kariarchaeaceae archaeon]